MQGVMVNSIGHLTRLRSVQIAGKSLLLGVSVRGFLEDISIQAVRLSKDLPLQCGWASSNPLRA